MEVNEDTVNLAQHIFLGVKEQSWSRMRGVELFFLKLQALL